MLFRSNIRDKGKEFLNRLEQLKSEFPNIVTTVQGTGLLFSMGINKDKISVVGEKGLELSLRYKGLGVIHGGTNSLRFTPHFAIKTQEVDLMLDLLREGLLEATA